MQKEATELAHTGEEEEALELYQHAIQIAGSEIARVRIRTVVARRREVSNTVHIRIIDRLGNDAFLEEGFGKVEHIIDDNVGQLDR